MFPQSNGEAERAVAIAKKILRQKDPYLALMSYRSTLNTATKISPALLMMNGNLQTTLPTMEKNIHPQEVNHEEAKFRDEQSKTNYAYYYDRKHSASCLPPLNVGDKVRMRDDKTSK